MSRPRSRRPATRAAAALLVILAALMAWSGARVVTGHRGESLGLLCSSIEDLCRAWAGTFTTRTGIPVTMVRLSSGEALTRLTRDGAREFDVWHGGPADLYAVAGERGLLAPYVSPEAAGIPAPYVDPHGAWTGTYVGVLGFCSDARALGRLGVPVPTSWDDLLDPRLDGLVSAPNPLTSGTASTLLGVQEQRLGSSDAAIDWLRRMDRNVLHYTRSGMAPAGAAARGEAAVAVTFTQHCVRLIGQGRDELRVSYPREGTGIEIGAVALVGGSRHPEWARSYVDFAVSPAGQSVAAEIGTPQLPTQSGLAADPALRAPARVPSLDPPIDRAAATKERLVTRFVREVRG